jgi:hypothetical protein
LLIKTRKDFLISFIEENHINFLMLQIVIILKLFIINIIYLYLSKILFEIMIFSFWQYILMEFTLIAINYIYYKFFITSHILNFEVYEI